MRAGVASAVLVAWLAVLAPSHALAPADGADLAEARGAGQVPGQARAAGGVKGSRCVERQDDRGRAEIFRGFARRCCGGQAAEGGEKREGARVPHLARAAKI